MECVGRADLRKGNISRSRTLAAGERREKRTIEDLTNFRRGIIGDFQMAGTSACWSKRL